MPGRIYSQVLWISEREMRERIARGEMPKHVKPSYFCCLSDDGSRLQVYPPIDPRKVRLFVQGEQ